MIQNAKQKQSSNS